jgi:hypothetical protein
MHSSQNLVPSSSLNQNSSSHVTGSGHDLIQALLLALLMVASGSGGESGGSSVSQASSVSGKSIASVKASAVWGRIVAILGGWSLTPSLTPEVRAALAGIESVSALFRVCSLSSRVSGNCLAGHLLLALSSLVTDGRSDLLVGPGVW